MALHTPWILPNIPNDCCLYRFAHKTHTGTSDGIPIAKPAAFKLKEDEDGLSCDLGYFHHPEKAFKILSRTYKFGKAEFKKPADYVLFRLQVSYLRSQTDVEVQHNPQFYGDPEVLGSPNNRAHTIVINPFDEEMRMKLSREHAKFVPVDLSSFN